MLTQLADDRRKSVRGQINNDLDMERLNMRFDGVVSKMTFIATRG